MSFKWIGEMDIYEIIRRWHSGQRISHIALTLGYDRKTVRKYIHHLNRKGLSLEKTLPCKEVILELLENAFPDDLRRRPPEAQQVLEPFLSEIDGLVNHKEFPLMPKIVFELLCEKYGLEEKVSYSSFKRFVRIHHIASPSSKTTCRIEVLPGSEIQIDYGYMGLLYDPDLGRRRKVYAFIATLSYSRHQYAEFVYAQTKESFVASHVRMFEYFGGVPIRILLDNLKSGVIKPDLYDPALNPLYREMALHYNCFIDPCRVAHPQDKGKTERQVPCVRQQFRKSLARNQRLELHQANQEIKEWCIEKHGLRTHGTTGWQPYPHFLEHEKSSLLPLPEDPFEIACWKECVVHPDHYIQFNKKTFSLPTRYIGEKLWVKGTDKILQVFHENRLVRQWTITGSYRHTDWKDFPENMKNVLDEGIPLYLQNQAGRVGPRFRELIRKTLEPHAYLNMRKAQGLVGLMKSMDHALLEKAASMTLDQHLSTSPKSFLKLIQIISQNENEEKIPISLFTQEFLRPMDYFTKNV